MNLLAKLLLETAAATNGADNATPAQGLLGLLTTVAPFVIIIVVFYFFMLRPQKKQQKETEQMRNSITEGDQVTTIGGIVGTVRQIKDGGELYVIETGANNDRLTVHKWAIQSKDTISE